MSILKMQLAKVTSGTNKRGKKTSTKRALRRTANSTFAMIFDYLVCPI